MKRYIPIFAAALAVLLGSSFGAAAGIWKPGDTKKGVWVCWSESVMSRIENAAMESGQKADGVLNYLFISGACEYSDSGHSMTLVKMAQEFDDVFGTGQRWEVRVGDKRGWSIMRKDEGPHQESSRKPSPGPIPVGLHLAQTSQRPVCKDRASILSTMAQQHKEAPAHIGLTNTGAVLEVLAAKSGSWTIILTTPQGVTCMIAAGEHWGPTPGGKPGKKGSM